MTNKYKNFGPSPDRKEKTPEEILYELQLHQIELEMQNVELRRAQTELEATRARYFDLYDLAPVGYFTLNEQGLILEANLTAATLLGVERRVLVNQPLSRFILPEDQDLYYHQRKQLSKIHSVGSGQRDLAQVWEMRLLKSDATPFWGRMEATLAQAPSINSGQDTESGFMVRLVMSDITKGKRVEEEKEILEARLWQARKAESLGRMAGAIAHQYNNLLAIVMSNLELTLYELPDGSRFRNSINEAMKASQRAAKISHLMLAYLGQDMGKKVPVGLSEASREFLASLTSLLPERVNLKLEFPASGPIIRANASQIQLVFSSLVTNAIEALEEREGTITLSIGVVEKSSLGEPLLHPAGWKPEAETYACLSIADTGCGMDRETREKAFDPFFSTRFIGRGLGLAVVEGVVKAHEGTVEMESSLGQGTTVRVYLPLTNEQIFPFPKISPKEPLSGEHRGLVLLVDDDPMIRDVVQKILMTLGYDSILAADGIEALDLFRQRQHEIQCVLLDLIMPRMGGWETLEALRKLRPGLLVILASGYDEVQVMEGEHPELPQVFLHKPFTINNLKAALAAVLEGRPVLD